MPHATSSAKARLALAMREIASGHSTAPWLANFDAIRKAPKPSPASAGEP